MATKYLIYTGIFLLLGACSNKAIYYNPDQKRSIYFNWELSKVESHDGVYSGTLSLFNDKTKANAGQLFIGADGKLSYSIAFFDQNPPEIVLETKRVPVYPHKEGWVEYKYVKK